MNTETNVKRAPPSSPPVSSNVFANNQDRLAFLPQDLIFYLFSFLDVESLCKCSTVNKSWNVLACSERS